MTKTTTRRQRILRALTPKRVRRLKTRWKRRAQKVAKTRAKLRGIWNGDVVVNGRRPDRKKHPLSRRTRHTPPAASPRKRQAAPNKAQPPAPPRCDGTCTNSDMEPDAAKAKGLCGMCVGRKELVTNFGGKHVHVRCGECDGSGLATVAAWRAAKKHGGGFHGSEAGINRPSRREAAGKTFGWFGLSGLFSTLFVTFGWAWAGVAAAGTAAVGGVAYRHERKPGVSEHGARTGRKAARQEARDAGCSAACMWSLKPADTCRCPCGGTTHGTAHKRKAAA